MEDDFLIDEPEVLKAEEADAQTPPTTPSMAELDKETKQTLEELRAFKEEAQMKQAIEDASDALREEYPSFDLEKISTLLKEMHKSDPAKAERYNNPRGWETLHLKHFEGSEEEGSFLPGRKSAVEPFEFEKTQKMALDGDKRAMQKLFDNAK